MSLKLTHSRSSSRAAQLALSAVLVLVPVASTLTAPGAYAQSATAGAIAGTIRDANGALLPATVVTIHSTETGQVAKMKSNGSGEFRFTDLQPGTYTVTFEADGFQTYVEDAVQVTVGGLSSVSPSLKVGSASDKVEVTDKDPLLNAESPAITTTIDQNAIDNLPINGRRWSNFALLTPGVVSNSDGFGLLSFRGISVLLNNSTVDGADNNQAYFSEERGRTRASYSISQAAVQEFQVNLSNYSAEYGRSAGGVINTVTKSGSNQFHGELFFYDRDNDFGGTNPYTTLTTQIPGSNLFQTYPYKPKDWRKQWGFGAGGAILHNRLFWFYSYDQSQHNFPGTARASDPADTFAGADSTLPTGVTCNVSTGTITTAAGVTAPRADGYACLEASKLNQGSYQAGAAYYQQGLGIIQTFLGAVPRHADQVLNFPKLDWQINDRNRLTIEYNRLRFSSPNGVQTQASNFYGRGSFGSDFLKEDFGILRVASVLSPTMVNNFVAQYGRDFEYETSSAPTPNEQPLSQLVPDDPLAPANPPDIQIGYEFDLKGFDIGRPVIQERRALPNERRLQGEDYVTFSHGNHVTKAGLEVNRVFDYIDNLYEEGGSYSYDYNWDFIADYLHATTGVGGANYTQQYYSFSQGFGNPRDEIATTDYAGFITDDWRVLPRLTLTAGVRYEYEYVPPNPLPNNGGQIGSAGGAVPQTKNQPDDRNNIGPRVGFALDIFGTGRTYLRGGYGMYYGRIINSNIAQTYLLSGGVGSQVTFSANTSNTCRLNFPAIYGSAAQYQAGCGNYSSTIAYLDKHLQNPQVHEMDLALEQNIGYGTVLSVTYLGSLGRELAAAVDQSLNPATGSTNFVVLDNPAPPTPGYVTYPHGGKPLPLLPNSVHVYKKYLPTNLSTAYPGYFHVLDFKSEVNSSYNALVFQVNHRFANNVSLISSFTWAHALDYNPYLSTGYGSATELLDPLNPAGEHANSALNVPHRFIVAGTYNTNFRGLNLLERETLNNWQIAPILQMQSGLPYSAGTTQSVAGGEYGGIIGAGGTARIPDIDRDAFTMPKTATLDLRLSKSFTFEAHGKQLRFQVLGEAFNLFNHQNITSVNTSAYCITTAPSNQPPATGAGCPAVTAAPAGTPGVTQEYLVGNPLFGTYLNSNSNTLLTPRQLQIAGRFYF